MNHYDTEIWPVKCTHGGYDISDKYKEAIRKGRKALAERIDREYLERIEQETALKIKLSEAAKVGLKWTEVTFNMPDPKVMRSYVGNAVYTDIIFDELEPEKTIADPKLQRILERNYELARIRHDVKQMRRLEKQMHANYK